VETLNSGGRWGHFHRKKELLRTQYLHGGSFKKPGILGKGRAGGKKEKTKGNAGTERK